MPLRPHRGRLEQMYRRVTRREMVHPDPLEFLYRYEDALDREVAGMVASALAYGRVGQILISVGRVLDTLGARPAFFLREAKFGQLKELLSDFRHRFHDGTDVAALLTGIGRVQREHGSLEACFTAGVKSEGQPLLASLKAFTDELRMAARHPLNHLLADPAGGSACKRLHLFLRWMVRRDAVDPGGWTVLSPARLIMPLDTHIHRLARQWGLTQRASADARTALEVTDAFRRVRPDDPVRYDFALSRIGIRTDVERPFDLSRC